MPVRRYRDLDGPGRDLRDSTRDLAERIRYVWTIAYDMVGVPPPRGVRKFRDKDEANAYQREWTRERALALRQQRLCLTQDGTEKSERPGLCVEQQAAAILQLRPEGDG